MRLSPQMILLAALLAPTAAYAQEGGESSPAPAAEEATEDTTTADETPAEAAPPAAEASSEESAKEAPAEAEGPEPSADEAAERAAIEALDEPSSDEELIPLPDMEAEELSEEEAAALEALQAEAAEPETTEAPVVDDNAATGWSYYDGRSAGEADARIAPNYMQHGIAGLLGGLICSGCGCVGVTAAELLISPGVPQGPWQANDSAYQRGYIDGYRKTMQRRRALYAVAGGTLGTAVAFGTGFAVGVYRGTPPFVNF